jgi:hypothetical protein
LTFGQSAPYESCGKYSNLSPCKISYFSEVPKYYFLFYFLTYLKSKWKRNSKTEKNLRGPYPSKPAHFYSTSAQPISAKLAHVIFLPRSLPRGSRCLADPTPQPLSFTGGNRSAPDPLRCPVPSQTRPLPPLLAALPAGEILATPYAKVLHSSLCELPVASLRLSPRLRTAGNPRCHRGIMSSCYVDRSLSSPLSRRDAGANLATMPHAAPLLPPSLLAPRAALSRTPAT